MVQFLVFQACGLCILNFSLFHLSCYSAWTVLFPMASCLLSFPCLPSVLFTINASVLWVYCPVFLVVILVCVHLCTCHILLNILSYLTGSVFVNISIGCPTLLTVSSLGIVLSLASSKCALCCVLSLLVFVTLTCMISSYYMCCCCGQSCYTCTVHHHLFVLLL